MKNRQSKQITAAQAIEPFEHKLAPPEQRSDRQMVGAIVNRREDGALLADWLIGCLERDEKPSEALDADAAEPRRADHSAEPGSSKNEAIKKGKTESEERW